MIGGLIAVAIAIWFYRTALAINEPKPVLWVIYGVVAYYLIVGIWWFLVVKPMSGTLHHYSPTVMFVVHIAGNLLGVLVVWFVRKRWVANVKKLVS